MKEELSTLSSSNLSLLSSSGPSQKIIRTILKAIPNLEGKQGDMCARQYTSLLVSLSLYNADNSPHWLSSYCGQSPKLILCHCHGFLLKLAQELT